MHVPITFSDPWTVPTVTFTDPIVHAENRWDPKTPAGSVWARAVCTLAFEHDFKSEFPHRGGVLNFLILYFCTRFHSGLWLNGSRHVSPPNKKEEKLQKRRGKKLQQSKFQVDVRKTHSWQSQSLTAGRGNPERLGKPSISGDFQRALGQGLEKPHLSFRLRWIICSFHPHLFSTPHDFRVLLPKQLAQGGLVEPAGPLRALVYFDGNSAKGEEHPQSTLVCSNCQNLTKCCSRTVALLFFFFYLTVTTIFC